MFSDSEDYVCHLPIKSRVAIMDSTKSKFYLIAYFTFVANKDLFYLRFLVEVANRFV